MLIEFITENWEKKQHILGMGSSDEEQQWFLFLLSKEWPDIYKLHLSDTKRGV